MRTLRLLLISLSMSLVILALAAANAHGVRAEANSVPPAAPLPYLHIEPSNPCAGEPVSLVAVIPQCPPCIDAVVAEASDPEHARIYVHAFECATFAACPPDTVRILLGSFPPGAHSVSAAIRAVLVVRNATVDSVVVDTTTVLGFVVSSTCVDVPPISLHSTVWIAGQPACESCDPVACSDRPIPLRIAGEFPSGCGHVAGVLFVPSPLTVIGPPTVRVLLDSDACLGRPCTMFMKPWHVDTLLPPLPVGVYGLRVEVAQVSCSDSIMPGRLLATTYPFQTSPTCSSQTAPRVQLATEPAAPCDGDTVGIRVRLTGCPPCVRLVSAVMDSGVGLVVTYEVRDDARCAGPAACAGDSALVPFGTLRAGHYALATMFREIHVRLPAGPDTVVTWGRFEFSVSPNCAQVPPIPLHSDVWIAGQAACDSCLPTACADRRIPLRVRGAFPSTCGHVRKVLFLPSPATVIGPPTVRILLDSEDCLERPCAMVETPWQVDTLLPALPVGGYGLIVEVAQVSCSDDILPGRLLARRFPFTVSATCSTSTQPPCFVTTWGPPPKGGCNTTIAPGRDAAVTMSVLSMVRLAGLQGVLRSGPFLTVKNLEAIGPAAGMHLQWVPTADGARFVMFATSGAPIPATLSPDGPREPIDPTQAFEAVLRITVALASGTSPPPVMLVRSDSLVGADSLAALVPECPDESMRPIVPGARVCLASSSCDVNHDGVSDVRDLVVMVHCILGGACPDTIAGRHDCDGDGSATIDDILCCARAILRGTPGDSLPRRDDPGIALEFGEPARTAGHVTLPITLAGAERVGALRMALRFPADRYDVSAFTAGSGWLALQEMQGDQLVLGLIALLPTASEGSCPLTLDLALKAGQSHGGEVTVASAEVSAPDGALVTTSLAGSGTPIEGASRVSLAFHPNPLGDDGATVRFALPLAAQVDIGLFDIAGRRVATLAQGAFPAGVHARTWQAQGLHDGVYFIRLRADGIEVAHKVVLRRGH